MLYCNQKSQAATWYQYAQLIFTVRNKKQSWNSVLKMSV